MDIDVKKLKKVDFFLPQKEENSWIAYLTHQLAKSFEQLGIQTRLLVSPKNKDPKPFLDELFKQVPDCTLCFNGVLPDEKGTFLADLIKIPHLAILTESPNNFLSLAKSTYTTTLSPDQQYLDILKQGGCARTLFFPLAAPIHKGINKPLAERKGSILMAPLWLDGEKIKAFWRQNLPKKMVDFLEEVVTRSLANRTVSYFHAFQLVMSELPKEEQEQYLPWTTFALFDQIESVLRETDTVELLSALDRFKIDLVVEEGTAEKWEKRLGSIAKNCSFQEGATPEETLYLMGNTKIFLASSPQFKFGSSGDLYTSLLMGAYTFHSQSEFLEQAYGKGRGLFFYPYRNKKAISEQANLVLQNPNSYQEEVDQGRKIVLESETWLNRAQLLIDFIPSILGQKSDSI